MTEEKKIAHLEMIQDVINRMGNNSFLIKGWAITLVSAIFALSIENHKYLFISLFPIILFWWLDAFFLRQEKLFRKLYNDVAIKEYQCVTYSMDTINYQSCTYSIYRTALSKTLFVFYGCMLMTLILFYLFRV